MPLRGKPAAAPAATAPKKKKPRSTEGAAEAKAAAKMTSKEWKALQKGMPEKWPIPGYMEMPMPGRSHTCYRDETFSAITRWCAETRIAYRPHAKSPGSKSHIRYERYSKAKSAREALKLGSWPADWCWDYERGFIKVYGPLRDEPLDMSKVQDESTLTDVDMAIHRWYRRELAKKLGLNYKDLFVGKGSGESTLMRAHRLVAQREASKRLKAAEKQNRPITEDEVLQTLREWAFGRNPNRQNVLPEGQDWVWSDTLGLLRDRMGDIHLTTPTKAYPAVTAILNKYLTDRLPKELASFTWTSLNLNCNYAARLHRDGNNFGPSFIKAFGNFTGGELNYWPEDNRKLDRLEDLRGGDKVQMDLKKGLGLFNGNCGHSVEKFDGERFSVVYFTISCYDQAPQECKEQLSEFGMNYPKSDADRYALLRAPRGYVSEKSKRGPATPSKANPPAYRIVPTREAGLTAVKPSRKRVASASPSGKATVGTRRCVSARGA